MLPRIVMRSRRYLRLLFLARLLEGRFPAVSAIIGASGVIKLSPMAAESSAGRGSAKACRAPPKFANATTINSAVTASVAST